MITSSIKVSLFIWSQVFKNLELKLMIDIWFRKFKFNTYIKKINI